MRLIILNKNEIGLSCRKLALQSKDFTEIFFLDDKKNDEDILAENADYFLYIDDETYFYPAFKDAQWKMNWIQRLMEMGANIASINLSKDTTSDSFIPTGCIISNNVNMSSNVRLQPGCFVDENSVIENEVLLGKAVTVGKNVTIHSNNYIPPFTVIEDNSVISENTYLKENYHNGPAYEARHAMFADSDEALLQSQFSNSLNKSTEISQKEADLKKENEIQNMLKALKDSGKSLDEVLEFLRKM